MMAPSKMDNSTAKESTWTIPPNKWLKDSSKRIKWSTFKDNWNHPSVAMVELLTIESLSKIHISKLEHNSIKIKLSNPTTKSIKFKILFPTCSIPEKPQPIKPTEIIVLNNQLGMKRFWINFYRGFNHHNRGEILNPLLVK